MGGGGTHPAGSRWKGGGTPVEEAVESSHFRAILGYAECRAGDKSVWMVARRIRGYHRDMSTRPTIQLSRLREIGWELWDPIGLRGALDEGAGVADEYDSYLLHVANRLSIGDSKSEATAYLNYIASNHMGLGPATTDAAANAAAATVEAIAVYLSTLPDGQ